MTRTAEQQARRYLRLFPHWMRADRGEEAVGLTLDQLPPGATRLPARLRWHLVRAGFHARRTGAPPAWLWFDVLTASPTNARGRVPEPWRPWVASFAARSGWNLRQAVAAAVPVTALVAVLAACGIAATDAGGMVALALFLVVYRMARGPRWHAVVVARNRLLPDGGDGVDATGWPERLSYSVHDGPAASALGRAALASGAVAAAALIAGLVLHETTVAQAVGACVLGAGVVGACRWLRRRALAAVPPEPARWRIHERRADNWALRILVLAAAVVAVASGFVGAVLSASLAVGLVLLRHGVTARSAALGREVQLWEAVPFVGPGATLTLPPALAGAVPVDRPDHRPGGEA